MTGRKVTTVIVAAVLVLCGIGGTAFLLKKQQRKILLKELAIKKLANYKHMLRTQLSTSMVGLKLILMPYLNYGIKNQDGMFMRMETDVMAFHKPNQERK